MRVRKLDMYPIECVVRGYLSGSGWREYKETGEICGIPLPGGMRESDKLREPIFRPSSGSTTRTSTSSAPSRSSATGI